MRRLIALIDEAIVAQQGRQSQARAAEVSSWLALPAPRSTSTTRSRHLVHRFRNNVDWLVTRTGIRHSSKALRSVISEGQLDGKMAPLSFVTKFSEPAYRPVSVEQSHRSRLSLAPPRGVLHSKASRRQPASRRPGIPGPALLIDAMHRPFCHAVK